jgi:DnaJ-class molecular chaperone
MELKNYYNILNISEFSSNKEIKNAAKTLFENIKKSNKKNKRYFLKNIMEAYQILYNDYSRKKYDIKLLKQKKLNIIKNYHPNAVVPSLFNITNNNVLNKFKIYDLPINTNFNELNKINNYKNNSYYHTSYTSSHYDKNGNIITEKKSFTKNNDKIYSNHLIITIDKNGKKTIKKIPIKNKDRYYLIKNKFKI